MNHTHDGEGGGFMKDALFTLLLCALLGVSANLGLSSFGLQNFGAKAQVLCRIAAILLVPLVLSRFWSHVRGRRSTWLGPGLVIFLLPVLFVPFMANSAGGASLAKGRKLMPSIPSSALSQPGLEQTAPTNPFTGKKVTQTQAAKPVNPGVIPDQGLITCTPETYMKVLDALYAAPQDFVGRQIRIEGLCYAAEGSRDGKFVVGRLLVFCCPGDGSLYGLQAKKPGGFAGDKDNPWFRVEGSIILGEAPVGGTDSGASTRIPMIQVDQAVSLPMPEDPFIYP